MIVNYLIKLFHISAVMNCQIRQTAGLFRETFLKGIRRKLSVMTGSGKYFRVNLKCC